MSNPNLDSPDSATIIAGLKQRLAKAEDALEAMFELAGYFQHDYTVKLPVVAMFRRWRGGHLRTEDFLKRLGDDDFADVLLYEKVPPMEGLALLNDRQQALRHSELSKAQALRHSELSKANELALIAEMEALPEYRGWRFSYEYPGYFCYSHPDSYSVNSYSVFFTPDWEGDETLPIQVQRNDGTDCEEYAVRLPLSREGRTGQKLFELVRPTLDKLLEGR